MTEGIPECYIDSFRMSSGAFGVALTMGLRPPHPEATRVQPPEEKVIIRMSLEHAKAMTMIMRRTLKEYERNTECAISLPTKLMNELGLSPEDW